jgi:hypothetical protein
VSEAGESEPAGKMLVVNEPGDRYEQEAERLANQLILEDAPLPDQGIATGMTPAPIQRACAGCDEEELPLMLAPVQGGHRPVQAPAALLDNLRGMGQPLPPWLRASFESRLGRDLGAVRVHNSERAGQAARSVGALAFTHGADIVFGAGQYAPETTAGRRLLAHEIVHAVQQGAAQPHSYSGMGAGRQSAGQAAPPVLSLARQLIQRKCVPVPTGPVISMPLDGLWPRWEAAEICLQNQYKSTHPGNVVGTNKDWTGLKAKPGSPEAADIKCFSANLVAKGSKKNPGMFLAQPDIIDFTAATMYDVTTPGQVTGHKAYIKSQADLAGKLAGDAENCSGRTYWSPGGWAPAPYYFMGEDKFIRTWNDGGVLVYSTLKDLSKEALLALLLAAAIGTIKQSGGKMAARAVTRNPYAAAALAAVVILVVLTTDAELAFAGEGDDLITGLLKAIESNGVKVPADIRKAIESDPKLKARLEALAKQGGDPSEKAKKAAAELLKMIEDNKEQFSQEDLEALVTLMELGVGKKYAEQAPTLEKLKQQLDKVKSGQQPDLAGDQSGGGGQGGGTKGGTGQGGAAKEGGAGGVPGGTAKEGDTGGVPGGTAKEGGTQGVPGGTAKEGGKEGTADGTVAKGGAGAGGAGDKPGKAKKPGATADGPGAGNKPGKAKKPGGGAGKAGGAKAKGGKGTGKGKSKGSGDIVKPKVVTTDEEVGPNTQTSKFTIVRGLSDKTPAAKDQERFVAIRVNHFGDFYELTLKIRFTDDRYEDDTMILYKAVVVGNYEIFAQDAGKDDEPIFTIGDGAELTQIFEKLKPKEKAKK